MFLTCIVVVSFPESLIKIVFFSSWTELLMECLSDKTAELEFVQRAGQYTLLIEGLVSKG